ncbi:MAG TPA: biopolymer transporter ExbD [Salinimicrobium sp.]|nr:biopolymer transporter ExbD [Salinimicrobium sp.]
MARRSAPEVNAGSMADIAFLLLIFFLVTTKISTDSGINSKLPQWQPEDVPPPKIKQKNIFTVIIDNNGQLLVEDELMELENLRESAIAFLDNGAEGCDYCQGTGDPNSSDNPEKAIISLQNDRKTSYGDYIAVMNELVGAYNTLRNREAERMYGQSFVEMEKNFYDGTYPGNKAKLEERIEIIRNMYPQKLSEAEPKE